MSTRHLRLPVIDPGWLPELVAAPTGLKHDINRAVVGGKSFYSFPVMARTRQGASRRRCGTPFAIRLLPLPEAAARQRMIAYYLTLSNLQLPRGDLAHFVLNSRPRSLP